ncbi:MAG: DUF4136 domain-containing protein [Desulfobulbaceae bacterium]|jgi:hypothetical protein|nr:DUF4136 domain-containing protein [Desulfobulbaceae bacterium]
MRYPLAAAIMLISLALTACSPVNVNQDYLQSFDFTRIHKYAWRAETPPTSADPRINNPLLRQRFHDAIDQTLRQRGYQLADKPDALIGYTYTIVNRLDSDQFITDYGFGYERRRGFGAFFGATPYIRQYNVSLLVIDVYDADGKRLLWRGTGSEILTIRDNPAELTAAVNRMVAEILAQFPPPTP